MDALSAPTVIGLGWCLLCWGIILGTVIETVDRGEPALEGGLDIAIILLSPILFPFLFVAWLLRPTRRVDDVQDPT